MQLANLDASAGAADDDLGNLYNPVEAQRDNDMERQKGTVRPGSIKIVDQPTEEGGKGNGTIGEEDNVIIGNANAGTFGRADKNKADNTLTNVVYFNSPNLWTNFCKDDYTGFAKEIDPMFKDAANGDLTIGNEDLNAGDPRWNK